jgi:hypothetical protein
MQKLSNFRKKGKLAIRSLQKQPQNKIPKNLPQIRSDHKKYKKFKNKHTQKGNKKAPNLPQRKPTSTKNKANFAIAISAPIRNPKKFLKSVLSEGMLLVEAESTPPHSVPEI